MTSPTETSYKLEEPSLGDDRGLMVRRLVTGTDPAGSPPVGSSFLGPLTPNWFKVFCVMAVHETGHGIPATVRHVANVAQIAIKDVHAAMLHLAEGGYLRASGQTGDQRRYWLTVSGWRFVEECERRKSGR